MEIVLDKGLDGLARVYGAKYRGRDDLFLEFVDSLSGSPSIEEKWVIVASSQFGCPVGCLMCDTHDYYKGEPTPEELFSQVDHLVRKRFPDGVIPVSKFKVQFARMGEPAMNPSVLDAIILIRERYEAPGFMPCISTTAPRNCDEFFERMMEMNHNLFRGHFQLQFSIHSTNEDQRDSIIPIDKWNLEEISEYGSKFFVGGRKIALNFALGPGNEIDVEKISSTFPSNVFMLKFTPVNPTIRAYSTGMVRNKLDEEEVPEIFKLRDLGYDVVLSIGDLRENAIGSNCGQLAALWRRKGQFPPPDVSTTQM
jgi:23S rRNA (adenine2503-C2)-methyltransferase